MEQKTLSVDSKNILPIIKKWLYSDKDVFIRELVSNSCDAIGKLKILRDHGTIDISDEEFRIDINIDKENKTITICDTGIGMTSEEVDKYISQIAFSGAKDFLEKYKTENEKDQIIGHFGLGFYSAYMVSSLVEIHTLSYQKGVDPVFWSCDGSSTYSIDKGTHASRGTKIILHVDKESEEYLDEHKIKQILTTYCSYLPVPIYLNNNHINNKTPLFIKNPSDCTDKEYIEFYNELYPMDPDPIFWIHLNVDYPFHLKGILYFPKIHKRFDPNQSTIKLFCNRVFVSDNCKDLFPDYLMVLKGALDSPDIPLNVSRSYLQVDKTVKQLSSHISKKITDRLSSIYKSDPEQFKNSWEDIELIIKLAILQDEKFYGRAKEFLIWKNNDNTWTTIEEYLERNKEKNKDKVFYILKENHHAQFLDLYKEKGLEVLFVNSFIDTPVISFLESKISPTQFQRIDGSLDDSLLDLSREKTLLDSEGKSQAALIAETVRNALSIKDLEVEAKSLASDKIPGFFLIDEQTRRLRDYMLMQGSEFPKMDKKTFVINTNNPLILAAHKLSKQKPELAKDIITQVYDLTSLSQKELNPKEISNFVSKTNDLLEKLVSQVS